MLAVISVRLLTQFRFIVEMVSCKEDALQIFKKRNGKVLISKNELQASIEYLQKTAAEEGLSEVEIDEIVNYLIITKINSQIGLDLFNCLIPKHNISNHSLEEILIWFFTEVANDSISRALARKCLEWLSGITHYELANVSIIESYYYSFIFLLSKPHLEKSVCRLLCQISKPEDARRWVVQQILHIPINSYLKPHQSALLSLLKSYRGNMVPESIPLSIFHYKTTFFDEILKKAHDRKLESGWQPANSTNEEIQWRLPKVYDEKSRKLSRLIPSADSLYDYGQQSKRHLQTVYEYKTMASLGVRPFQIDCPAEVLSLLANVAGHHILTFGDFAIKSRFFHKLYHTLCRVYLLELECYTEREKIFFLNSIRELQEYSQQSIPVVTTFLFYYLPIWDGRDCQEQILGLLDWIEGEEEDLKKYIFGPLRQIFISSGTHCKCLIIETMGRFLRNLLFADKKEQNCFRRDFQNLNVITSIEAVHAFVSELISNGLIWNKEKATRDILNAALNFYENTLAVEQAGDLPLIMVMPPALVYSCLFSNSRVCISRMCSLLIRLQQISVERLYLLGVFQDFAGEVQKLNIYTLDYYRCLWSKLDFREDEDSFIFQSNVFCREMSKLQGFYGEVIDRVFGVEYNSSFWDPKKYGMRREVESDLSRLFPPVCRLKRVTEERLLQDFPSAINNV